MADFDPFANQGGPAAWDPEHADDSREKADELLRKLGGSSGAEPGDFGAGAEEDDSDARDTSDTHGTDDPDDDIVAGGDSDSRTTDPT